MCIENSKNVMNREVFSQNGNNVFLASRSGACLDSNVVSGGGTDDTDVLQCILDKAPAIGSLHLIIDGAALVRGLNIHSNTTIECSNPSCGFFLVGNANRSILRNANPSRNKIIDRNITVIGGSYNHNRANQAHHREDNSPVTAIEFFGIEQLSIRDVVIFNQRTYAVFVSNWRRAYMEKVNILLTDLSQAGNTDGLHFCGPGQFLTLRDIQGCTYDDFIALNADDGHTSYDEHGELYNNGEQGPFVSFGPITDVLIDGVFLDEAAQGIRFLSRKSRIDRVVVRNVVGTYRSYGFFMDPFYAKGGNYGNIIFDTIALRALKPNYDYLPAFLFAIGGHHESLTIRNLHHHHPCDNRRLIWVEEDADIDVLTVDGLEITSKDTHENPRYIIVQGKIKNLCVRNVRVTHTEKTPDAGCLIETREDKHANACVDHLQIENVTTRYLGAVLRHCVGRIGHLQMRNVTAIGKDSAVFCAEEKAVIEVILNTDVVYLAG